MHSFRVSGGEERHQFFLSEKIARLEEEHQRRETPTKTPKPTKRSHQRKDFDNTTDAALLSLLSLERDLKTYYSGFIFIRACLVSVFILFKVKRQRHLFPSFFTFVFFTTKGSTFFAQLISVSLFCNGFFL